MIQLVTQHSYVEKKSKKQMGRLQNNPSIRWVHPKSTQARPLAWANKKLTHKPITLFIQPTFNSRTPIPAQKVFPQCLWRTEPMNGKLTLIQHYCTMGNNKHYIFKIGTNEPAKVTSSIMS